MPSTDCIFCSMAQGTMPAQFVAENDQVYVIKDIAPKAAIHYLIIPKQHYKDLQQIESEGLLTALLRMAQKLSRTYNDIHYRVMMNTGHDAGQRVFHAHMHFLAGSSLPEF